MKFAISFAVLLAVASALPWRNDYEKRMKQAEVDATSDLYEFIAAYKNNDSETLRVLTDKIVEIAESGKKHSEQIVPALEKLQETMAKVGERGYSHLMKAIAWFIDGKRDNESYADLETIIRWTRKRIDRGAVDETLAAANVAAKEAQDKLQLMAGTLVEGVKELRKDISNMREINAHIGRVFANNKDAFLDKFEEALANLKAFRNNVSTKSANYEQ